MLVDLAKENWRLEQEIIRLNHLIKELEHKLSFFHTHQTLAEGIRGEKLISTIVNGDPTTHGAPYDITAPSGERIEVKSSKLLCVYKERPSRRWLWSRVYGSG